MTAIAIDRIENGKIVEHWSEVDNLGLMQQLGVVPTPEPPPAEEAGTPSKESLSIREGIFSDTR